VLVIPSTECLHWRAAIKPAMPAVHDERIGQVGVFPWLGQCFATVGSAAGKTFGPFAIYRQVYSFRKSGRGKLRAPTSTRAPAKQLS